MRNPFKRKPEMTGYVYNAWEHEGWGNSIIWSYGDGFEKRQITGWLWRKPTVGDEIRFKMESGKIARFRVQDVEHASGVHDMFFAHLMDIGYVGEDPINPIKEAEQVIEPNKEARYFS
jgi:hypothetical protein